MSNILDLIQSQLSGDVIEQLSNKVGGNTAETQSAIQSAIPTILKALTNNVSTTEGASSLANALEKDHDGSILNDLMGFITAGNDTNGGNGILQHLFGDKRQNVEQEISQQSGLNSGATSNLMTQLAPIVMGFLGQQKKQGGLDIGGIASLVMNQFTGARTQSSTQNGQLDMITSLLDRDGDGSIMNEAMDIGKGLLGNLFGRK